MTIEFKPWPKIARLANEQMTITEKIDGTNACVIMLPDDDAPFGFVYACQSRNKLITPESDNAGFAKWAYSNIDELWSDLGPGYHYGEFWGSGIQRGYGMQRGEKFFSLFNAPRWTPALGTFKTKGLNVVPMLYQGDFESAKIKDFSDLLYSTGSFAAPGFASPEGIVIHLREAQITYKITDAVVGTKVRLPNE